MMASSVQKRQAMANTTQPKSQLRYTCSNGKLRQSIYQHGAKLESETLQSVANIVSNKQLYFKRMKQRDMEEDFGQLKVENPEVDPRIKYMKRCIENLNMNLPILDKIYSKTLCLQDYHLSDGNCQGLAEACQYLDHKLVNRMLFNNCGLSGDQLAVILDGVAKMKDFKSLIYRLSSINALAIEKMGPLFQKFIPNHLQELKLIDCQMTATLIEQLMDSLLDNKARINKIALVNVHHSDRSFDKVVNYVQEAVYLYHLDLSWQGVRPQQMLKLLQVINKNRLLVNVSLAYNTLLEDQRNAQNIQEVLDKPESLLSQFNQQVVKCFEDFIKYNLNLVHINLESTGLTKSAIQYISSLLGKSQALRCIHFCGNLDINDELVQWIRKRIHAKGEDEDPILQDAPSLIKYGDSTSKGNPIRQNGQMKIIRHEETMKYETQQQKNQNWKDIRKGLKLRNIVQSMRINDMGTIMPGIETKKLIIQRQLGHKELMPGSAQWGVFTQDKDDCWICGNYIMTVFIWTPRIGELTKLMLPAAITHYEGEMDRIRHSFPQDYQIQQHKTPYILGNFTNWRPIKMQEVIPYCIKNDPKRPDFIQECIKDGKVRSDAQKELNEKHNAQEIKAIEQKQQQYYKEHWHRALLTLTRYKNPQVANSGDYSMEALKDNNQPIFFHVDFLKPGKNTYLVEQTKKKDANKDFFAMMSMDDDSFNKVGNKSGDSQKLYVHQMLTQFRQEEIPIYHNHRHVKQRSTKELAQQQFVLPVFRDWKEDGPEQMGQIIKHDWQRMRISKLVPDEEQQKRIKSDLLGNLHMFKEIHTFLQSKSPSFPWIDIDVLIKFFVKDLYVESRWNLLTRVSIHNMVLECCVQGEIGRGQDEDVSQGKKKMCRYQFFEFLIRLGILYFGQDGKQYQKIKEQNQYQETTQPQAFYLFTQNKIKPWYENQSIQWQSFRDDELWVSQIEIIYSLNETALRKLFKQYCRVGTGNTLSMHDIELMFIRDTTMPITKAMVREAFIMSQMSVCMESDEIAFASYSKAKFCEFLEIVSRLAVLLFEGSEMEDHSLKIKLEHVMDQLFEGKQFYLQKNNIVIEEFSDSDDDY